MHLTAKNANHANQKPQFCGFGHGNGGREHQVRMVNDDWDGALRTAYFTHRVPNDSALVHPGGDHAERGKRSQRDIPAVPRRNAAGLFIWPDVCYVLGT
jgi:hypothetical protein